MYSKMNKSNYISFVGISNFGSAKKLTYTSTLIFN